jgi:hypothetical protein
MPSTINIYPQPRILPRSRLYRLHVDGQPVPVLHTAVADFALFECEGPVEVAVDTNLAALAAAPVVRPLARGIVPQVDGPRFGFTLPGPQNLMLDVPGQVPLLLYANPPEREVPREGPAVRRFRAGQVYEVGELVLDAGETLYVEGGAVVRGNVFASAAHGVRLRGRGIIDGGFYTRGVDERRTVVIEGSRDVLLEDLLLIEPSTWMTVLGACDGVRVRNWKEIGEVVSSDGIDIVGSRNVEIEGCCLKNNDDCIAVKSVDARRWQPQVRHDWARDVAHVRVRGCIFMNDRAGNVLEIGHELRTERVHDIVFEDCDCLHCHGNGAVFSIHAGDRATVEDVRFERIRVEHYWDHLIDLRVMRSRFNHDSERGRIRDVLFRDITVHQAPYNPGYSTSLIGGWDADHLVENIRFENFTLGGQPVLDADALDLHTRHARGITFA